MSEFEADHAEISAAFLRDSRQYLADGQLLQASEKGWGAAAHAAMFIAGIRQWSYQEHWEFNAIVVAGLSRETGDNDVHLWGRSANELHINFYRDDKNAGQIAAHLNDVANLVNFIRRLTGLPPVDD